MWLYCIVHCMSVVFAVLMTCLQWCCGWILKTDLTLKNTLSIFLGAWVPAKGNHAWGPPALLSISPEFYSPSYWAKLWAHYLSWGLLPFPVLGWRFAHFYFSVLFPTPWTTSSGTYELYGASQKPEPWKARASGCRQYVLMNLSLSKVRFCDMVYNPAFF